MSSEFEEALMGLDLGANPPETFNENVMARTRVPGLKSDIHRMKKRIISSDKLIKAYNDTKEIQSNTERRLDTMNTEHRIVRNELAETCKNYQMLQERCSLSEMQLADYKNKCRELELLQQEHESKEAAAQIYINQLQQLVKEHESKYEALKLENNLIKEGTIGYQKRITKMSGIIAALMNNLGNVADVVFNNRTLNKREKIILYKYMRNHRTMKEKGNKNMVYESDDNDDIHDDDANGDDDDGVVSELEDTADEMAFQIPSSTIVDNNDSDNAVSEDTGRGSSPLSSEKGNCSPEYCFEVPPSVGSTKIIHKESDCHVTTTLQSPKPLKETREFATSPIPKVMINQATSPQKPGACTTIDIPEIVYTDTDVTSDEIVSLPSVRGKEKLDEIQPLSNIEEKTTLDGIKRLPNIGEKTNIDGIEPLIPVDNIDSEKFVNLCDEHSNDEEIEMILENMRVDRDLVTPIPSTPARSISRSTILSRLNKDIIYKEFASPEFVDAVLKVMEAVKAVGNVSEKGVNTQANDCDKESNEQNDSDMELDDCANLDECEDPIILDPSFSKNKPEEKQSFVKPMSKPSQKLLFEDDPDDKPKKAVKLDNKLLKDKRSAVLEKIKVNVLNKNTESDNMLLARELRSRKIISPITTKKRENANNKVTKKAKKQKDRNIYDDKCDGESDDGDSSAKANIKSSKKSKIKETNENSKVAKMVDVKNNESGEVKSQKGGVTGSSRSSTECNDSELITPEELGYEKTSERNSMELRDNDLDDCDSLADDPIILRPSFGEEPTLNTSQTLLFEEDPPSQDEAVAEFDTMDKGVEQSKPKNAKPKKLSKLQKIRKTFGPKSKIKSADVPRKLRSRVLSAVKNQKKDTDAVTSNKKECEKPVKVTKEESSATLNEKEAYEKAAKVAAELRAKLKERETTKSGAGFVRRNPKKSLNVQTKTKPDCSDEIKKTVSKENTVNDHNKKDSKSLVNSSTDSENRNIRLSADISKLITLVPLKRNEKGRRKSYQEGKVCKIIPRKQRSNSDSQTLIDPVEVRDLITTRSVRKSLSTEFDLVKVCNRSKYPSFSLDKDPVIVINQSDVGKNIKDVENNSDKKCKKIGDKNGNGSRKSLEKIKTERRKSTTPPKDKVESKKCDAKEANNIRKRPYEGKSARPKRVLRSSMRIDLDSDINMETRENIEKPKENAPNASSHSPRADNHSRMVNYSDLDLFVDEPDAKKQKLRKETKKNIETTVKTNNNKGTPRPEEDSILIRMIEKYGVESVKTCPRKPNEDVADSVNEKIQKWVTQVNDCHKRDNVTQEMNNFVGAMKKLKFKEFMAGLMKFLADPQRKIELYNKVNAPPAPLMTKTEQVLLYVIPKLRRAWPDVDTVEQVFIYIEHVLFKLNGTPEFDAVESMSHFYALLCRYIDEKNKLRLFMLNAMYCINFKAIPLIKQCLDVWMLALPLAHLHMAKEPLVTCIVYLLHYYKTKEDLFNRVQEIRNILSHKYFYTITDWNETKILNMFKHAILELKDSVIERKMLRLALVILAKRQGPRWCQNKLISNLLNPLIDQADVPDSTKAFCVSMLGSLARPFPQDMKVHCEIIMNKLLDLLDTNPPPAIQEGIVKSLIIMNKHNSHRVVAAILNWHPTKVSPELENLLKDLVREKPVKSWKALVRYIY